MILRGSVEKPKTAGPAKEAALASACLVDHWSQDVLDCIGREPDGASCLSRLDAAAQASLNNKLKAWAEAHDGETADVIGEAAVPEAELDCVSSLGDLAAYAPALMRKGEERDFAVALRRSAVMALCDTGWDNAVKVCFASQPSPEPCRAKLDVWVQQAMAMGMTEVDLLLVKIDTAKAKPPATYDCKAVVASHYSDAAWKGKAEVAKNPKATRVELATIAADRKRLIADSRKLMLDACTGEAWNATARACEIINGGDACSQGIGHEPRWGFPAAGLVQRTGIPECDVYVSVTLALNKCDKFPQASKDALRQSLDAQRAGWNAALGDPTTRGAIAYACNQGEQAIRQAASAMGCAI